MNESTETKTGGTSKFRMKLFGVGGAGCNAVTHMMNARGVSSPDHHPLAGIDLIAMNTDLQSLEAAHATEKIQLGTAVTHGLGAGGDPEIGMRAAQQDTERLEMLVQNADVILIAAGLGGGTGGGATPVLARVAKSQGALVVAFVAMPFSFEGERRQQQALVSLEQLKTQADAVIRVKNDKLFHILGENVSVVNAFRRCDEMITSGAQAIWQLLARKGLINLDFADLRATLGSKHCEGVFSYGEARGQDKARDAVKALLENPILEGGDALAKSEGVLVSILGGPELTLTEVQKVVEPITKLASRARVVMGAAIDESYRDRIAVTVIASTQSASSASPPGKKAVPYGSAKAMSSYRSVDGAAAAPVAKQSSLASAPAEAQQQLKLPKQETLPLEGISRGRFEKSEPTLYNGENLDVPTFLRRGISLKR